MSNQDPPLSAPPEHPATPGSGEPYAPVAERPPGDLIDLRGDSPDDSESEAPRSRTTPPRPEGVGEAIGEDRRAATRERIVAAAADVFREKGFTGTRVVDIARRAGFTSGALYGYFDSRADLLAEAVGDASGKVLDHAFDGVADAEPGPEELIEAVLAQISSPLDESSQMLLDGVALSHREPVVGERLAASLRAIHDQLGEGDSESPSPTEELLIVLILGVTAARAMGLHDSLPPNLAKVLADALD